MSDEDGVSSRERCSWFASMNPCERRVVWHVLTPMMGPKGGIERPVCDTASMSRYPVEVLSDEADNGRMPENVGELADAVIGHRIVSVEAGVPTPTDGWWDREGAGAVLTLDNGKRVTLGSTADCCAYTTLKRFLLHPERVDHIITGVGTTGEYTTWHIYADLGDVLELEVGWSCGNPFYYGYGFEINVLDEHSAEEQPE